MFNKRDLSINEGQVCKIKDILNQSVDGLNTITAKKNKDILASRSLSNSINQLNMLNSLNLSSHRIGDIPDPELLN